MPIGIQPTKAEIDQQSGDIARRLNIAFGLAADMQAWLATEQDADLEALGYSAGEVAVLKSAFADLDKLRKVYEGTFVVTAGSNPGEGTPGAGNGYNFRTFPQQLWGFGF